MRIFEKKLDWDLVPEPPAAAEMAGEGNHVLGPGLVDVLEVRHEAVAVPESDERGNEVITDDTDQCSIKSSSWLIP